MGSEYISRKVLDGYFDRYDIKILRLKNQIKALRSFMIQLDRDVHTPELEDEKSSTEGTGLPTNIVDEDDPHFS